MPKLNGAQQATWPSPWVGVPQGQSELAESLARRGRLSPAGEEEQLGALGLILNTIVPYDTIYAQRALDHLKTVDRTDILPGFASSASTLPSASTLFP
jgi:hypothetical protein